MGFWALVLAMGLMPAPSEALVRPRDVREPSTGLQCVDAGGKPMAVDNAQVVKWKTGTRNAWRSRAYVSGKVVRDFGDRNDHAHFEIQIGEGPHATLEVVFNKSFGRLPEIRKDQVVSACGVYITSIAQTGPYPPSESGAIIHWVHHNPSGRGERDGFITIDGVPFGTRAQGRPRRPIPETLPYARFHTSN
jgi:hypothetical protein